MAKHFKFAMSHNIGKIEIVGKLQDEVILKIHDAKHIEQTGKLFTRKVVEVDGWLSPEFTLKPKMNAI